MKPAANLNALWARALVDELVRGGVREAVVCPGSRSAPLALALAENAQITTRSILDERSAAFFALGAAKATGRPAVVVATSGTAGAHFYPAILEAEASRVGLFALTADRPPELHGWGAPQTIDQQRLFGGHVRFFADAGLPEGATLAHLRATVARACDEARAGPVHLNAPFREPLAPIPGPLPEIADRPALRHVRARGTPDVAEAARELAKRPRGVIVCGPRDAQDELPAAVRELSFRTGYAVLAEAGSQVRGTPSIRGTSHSAPEVRGSSQVPDDAPVAHYDSILRSEPWARALRPDAVVRIGGGLTSKVLQAFVRGAYTVALADRDVIDPFHDASLALFGDATATCRALSRELSRAAPDGTSPGLLRTLFGEAERRAAEACTRAIRFGEPLVARETVAALREGALLFVSSSMPIRDVDAFGGAGARVLANRGVNGIDGVVSSALGAAAAVGCPATVLLGDLALLHDLAGVIAAKRLGVPITIVCVDNAGGGIFSFLPIARHTERFEELFATPQGVDLAQVAALAGLRFHAPTTADALRTALAEARGGELICVRTNRADNVADHEVLHAAVAAALGSPP